MFDPFLDHIPSREREKIRRRLRSPEAYAALREKVKGPEDLEREMEKMDHLAEVHLRLESEPASRDKLRSMVQEDIQAHGIEAVFESVDALTPDTKKALEAGRFQFAVRDHPATHQDALVAIPEGTVQENVPVKQSFSETYASTLLKRTS